MTTPSLKGINGGVSVGATGFILRVRCPYCRRDGAFGPVGGLPDASWGKVVGGSQIHFQIGVRACPNPDCQHVVFYGGPRGTDPVVYPPETVDFDPSSLPAQILATLDEAVRCHAAGAHRATAIMVRRVLEELCDDRGAKGPNLVERLRGLSKTVVIPQELIDAANELRLLGNDAAHLEAKLYDNIGPTESLLALELAKELLKAVYQYANLVSRLRQLRKPPEPA